MTHLAVVALATGFLLAPLAASGEVLFVQDDDYPPYMTMIDGAPHGILTDIINAAKKRMTAGDTLQLEARPWPRASKLVELGSAQALVGTYYKPTERPWIGTFSEPMLIEQVAVYCRQGIGDPNWVYPRDFAGLTFGNNAGYQSPGPEFFKMVAAGEIYLEEAQSTEQNLMKVKLGRIDCYVQERLAAEAVIRLHNFSNIEFIGIVSEEASMIGYSRTWSGQEANAFIKDFDSAILSMKSDGTIADIIKRHISGR